MRLHTGPHGRVRAALPRASPALGPDPNPILLTLGLPIPLPPVQGLCAISQSALMGGGISIASPGDASSMWEGFPTPTLYSPVALRISELVSACPACSRTPLGWTPAGQESLRPSK